jgi:isopentenyl-diphosphate delta-isomerase
MFVILSQNEQWRQVLKNRSDVPETHSGDDSISGRKSDHIRINLEEDVFTGLKSGLERYSFDHNALPDINLSDVDLSQDLFGKHIAFPLLISSMTGGTEKAFQINQILAEAAQSNRIAMGVGSQRAAIEDPSIEYSFKIRSIARDALLFANLGAIQLNYGYSVDHCRRAVDMLEADALILHLNALQEALQPEGQTQFKGLLDRIETICKQIGVPVIAKEVGWGISERTARQLSQAGVAAIDVAGAGGTSWAKVEKFRARDKNQSAIADTFGNWGIPTAESIQQVKKGAPETIIFASGGLKNGIDITKCIALGASLGGIAGEFLRAADVSGEEVMNLCTQIKKEIQIAMFAAGVRSLAELKKLSLKQVGDR